tara:strand:+ start:6698 stop:6862 length:165 start_codon:yes stop_codon:yes gene_type:complete
MTKNLKDTKEAIVIDHFLKLKENTVPNIAKKTGLLESTINTIINKYLKSKVING